MDYTIGPNDLILILELVNLFRNRNHYDFKRLLDGDMDRKGLERCGTYQANATSPGCQFGKHGQGGPNGLV